MILTESLREKIIKVYISIIIALFIYNYFTQSLLFQVKPILFHNRLDFTTWIVLSSNLHKILLNNTIACAIADILFYGMPLVYYSVYKYNVKLSVVVAMAMIVVNLAYTTIYPTVNIGSIEGRTCFVLFPILFSAYSLSNYWFIFQGLRYFFLYFFFSAGVWKITQGGAFNLNQMSSILIFQHKELLVEVTNSWLISLYRWLIDHPLVSFLLYCSSTIVELSFLVGFFSKRFDRVLIFLFLLFLIMNSLLMKIEYWNTLPFIIMLYYSKMKFDNIEN